MTVKTKSQVKAGRKVKLASWLSMSGALAMVLFGAPVMVAQGRSEPNGRTAPVSLAQATPPEADTQGPNAAPDLQQGTPDPGSTEPAMPDTNVDPSTPEADQPQSPAPAAPEADTQGPNAAPDLQQGTPDPGSTEPATPAPTESPAPEATETREENIVFVRTAEGASTGEVVDNPARFNQIVGSGRLLVNGDDQVTGYYFTVSGLPQNQTLPYHFHDIENEGTSTSCEGDKGVLEDEAAGAVITPLSDIAPLQSTAGGIAIVGTASNPVQLPNPVPLANIGYLNIHADPSPTAGIVCANVPLQPISFAPSETPDSESAPAAPESDTQGPNAAPDLQQGTPDPGSTEPATPDTNVDPSTPETDQPQSPAPAAPGSGTQGPNSAPDLQQGTPDPGSTEPATPDTNVEPSTPDADQPQSPAPAGNPTSQPDNPPTQGPNSAPQTN